MFSRRSPPKMTASDRVRQLWAQFEIWHAAETKRIEKQVTDELRELDTKWRQTPSKKRSPKAEHEARKKTRRGEIVKTFNGNVVREEWQKRLDGARLQSDDWTDLTDIEQQQVEKILGADLDLEAMELPVAQSTPSPPSGTLFAPSIVNDSRVPSTASESYALVKPSSSKQAKVEENTYEPWMQVVHKTRSDDEISLDASTTSSWGFGGGEGPAYLSWSSAASRSSAQTSQASSPEHATKYLAPEVKQQSLLSAAARRLSPATERPSRNENKYTPPPQSSQIPLSRTESLNSLSSENMSGLDEFQPSHSRATSKPYASYIGPYLTDSHETDEETEFQRFKMNVRVQKIREFHDEAAMADIRLTLEIDEARRLKKSNSDSEAKLLKEHEQKMIQLRKSKEEERKAIVEAERYRRRAAMRSREAPPDDADFGLPSSFAAHFLKGLKETEGSVDSGGTSDTSTIRMQRKRAKKPSLQTDWMSGGGETPTPTSRVSTWAASSSHLSQTPMTDSVEMFADAPLKRGTAGSSARPSSSSRKTADATPTKAEELSPWSMMAAKAQKLAASVVDATLTKTEEEPSPWAVMAAKKAQKASSALADATPTREDEPSPWSIMASRKAQKSSSSLAEATPTKVDDEVSPWAVMAARKAAQRSATPHVEPILTNEPTTSNRNRKSVPLEAPPTGELSPWEIMAAKQAQKSSSSQAPPVDERSPWEIMAAKKAQKSSLAEATLTKADEAPSPWSAMAAKNSIPGGWDEEPVTDSPPSKSESRTEKNAKNKLAEKAKEKEKVEPPKPVPAPVPAATGKGKKKKGKASAATVVAQNQSEVSSSDAASNAVLDPPASTKPAKGDVSAKSKGLPVVAESETSAWNAEPSPALTPSISSSFVWSSSAASKKSVPLSSQQQPSGSKTTNKKLESSQVSDNASSSSSSGGILKKSGASKSKLAKGTKKKVTIEEVSGDEGDDPVPDGVEHLPSDSRYIMEPKPVVPSEVYSPVFEYGEEKRPDSDAHQHRSSTTPATQQSERWSPPQHGAPYWTPAGQENELWIPPTSGRSIQPQSNDIWLPSGVENAKVETHTRSKSGRSGSGPGSGSGYGIAPGMKEYATWIPAGSSGGSHRRGYAPEPEPEKDLFLSALDSLEKIVRGDEPPMRKEGMYETDNLDRLFSGVNRGLERERSGDGGEALWQALSSFGKRSGAASAW